MLKLGVDKNTIMSNSKKVCCGLDVHKETIFAAINANGKAGEVKEYSTLTCQIQAMCDWLKANKVTDVAMESTGIYWIPIWNILEASGFRLTLVNPYFIKQMPGRKSDVKDSQWIAQLLAKDMLKKSLIPCHEIRTLRWYSREYVKRQQSITRIVVSMERTLETANIRITSMVSKIESKTVLNIIELIIKGETDINKLLEKVHGRTKNRKGDLVAQSLEGFVLPEHRFILSQQLDEYRMYYKQADELQTQMLAICKAHYSKEMELLKTMPGTDDQSAMQLIAETGANMNAFETSNKLSNWAGLCPRNDESAGKIKSKATTKGNKYLRRIIVQIAWASSRTKSSSYYNKYNQLAIRKGRKKALVAMARKQLTVVWNILKYEQPYDINKQPVITPEQILAKKKYYEKELGKLNVLAIAMNQ
jgi:transposase